MDLVTRLLVIVDAAIAYKMVSKEDWMYFAILVASVPLGWIVARFPPGKPRQWFCSIISLILTIGMCGRNVLHPFFTIVVNALIIKGYPQ